MPRCAIYTRKSHEEGLDQAFNSLDAQREAGLDYIRSQRHEGWQVIETRYDDGGYSGGTIERPALKRLLEDIERGRLADGASGGTSGGGGVVVVYKVDRLSRSLHDFAGMMKVFDEHGVSFVSVTQQFNTTISMGRLTLNMLLSFAQFEREVTGKRIRDKLAATKKKGLWVTGQPPLGYQAIEQKLRVVPDEAAVIRRIYEGYLESGSLVQLARQLSNEGHTTKRWRSRRGRAHGGRRLTPKYLYRVFTNAIYIGKITHKDNVWPGQHAPIIEQHLWDRVQAKIEQLRRQTRHRWSHTHLLKGKLKTADRITMSPSATQRPTKGSDEKRNVLYYVSQKAIKQGYKHCPIKSLNARHLDELLRALVLDYLDRHESFEGLHGQEASVRDHGVRAVLHRVCLATDRITVELCAAGIEQLKARDDLNPSVEKQTDASTPTCLYRPDIEQPGSHTVLTLSIQIKRLDGRRLLLSPDGHDLFMPAPGSRPEPHIVRAIGQAYGWKQQLERDHLTLTELAQRRHLSDSRFRKYLPLTNLSPEVLRRALTGYLPPSITLQNLLEAAKHLDWQKQASYLRLAHFPDGPAAGD